MPVPRIFEAQFDPREHWTHVVATLLGLAGPQTRGALVEEITGEELPEADAILVREQRPLGSADAPLVADIVARGAGWTVAVQSSLAFDVNEAELLAATWDALSEVADKSILVALTPDRREPAALGEAREGGRDIRHLSWLRTRDWVQERPERGKAAGVDLMLLREAEYFLTPRVAELYRLESVMPLMSEELRPAFASIFFTLNEAKVLVERWRQDYNRIRPHSALGYRPPAPEAMLPGGPGFAPLRLGLQAAGSSNLAERPGLT